MLFLGNAPMRPLSLMQVKTGEIATCRWALVRRNHICYTARCSRDKALPCRGYLATVALCYNQVE
jgi:hypothetical protein